MTDAKVRLQKYMAEAGIASRRKSEELIAAGKVRVNGKVAEIGDKINPRTDKVTVSGKVKYHISRTVWNIYENDIDKIIKKICRRDSAFAERIAKCEPTLHDVELIIRRASFKSLKLKISNSPFYLYVGDDV